MTPLADPHTVGERNYNSSFNTTRNIVERQIGIWKRRFPCLAYGIRLKLQTTMTVIGATAVLHNIARQMNEPDPPLAENINVEELNYLIQLGDIPNDHPIGIPGAANRIQNQLVADYFTNL